MQFLGIQIAVGADENTSLMKNSEDFPLDLLLVGKTRKNAVFNATREITYKFVRLFLEMNLHVFLHDLVGNARKCGWN